MENLFKETVETPVEKTVETPVVETEKVEAKVETPVEATDDFVLSDTVEDVEEPAAVETPAEQKAWWEVAKEKLGVDADNEDDFVKKASTPKFVDERDDHIRSLKEHVKKSDEDLVRAELEAKGWNKEKIDKRIEQLADRDELEYVAEDIRSGLNQAISERQMQIDKAEKDASTNAVAFRNAVNENIAKGLSKTDELFGFKVGRNEDEVAKWQKGMKNYFAKDGFNQDLSKFIKDAHEGNPQALIELAQFIKSREGVFKGLVQKGKSQASKEILSELRNEKTPQNGERKEERKDGGFKDFLR